MLTLEEAVAELDKLLAFGWIRVGTRVNAEDDEIRAAVKNVALAAVRAMCDEERGLRSISPEAEINRLFPHG